MGNTAEKKEAAISALRALADRLEKADEIGKFKFVMDNDSEEIEPADSQTSKQFKLTGWQSVNFNIRFKIEECDHNWVDATNEVIKNGKYCTECHAIKL